MRILLKQVQLPQCATTPTMLLTPPPRVNKQLTMVPPITLRNLEHAFFGLTRTKPNSNMNPNPFVPSTAKPAHVNRRWMEYQGIKNWEGLLDPLDENLRGEIIRYGQFVTATYQAFEFDASSPSYATCRFPKKKVFHHSGLSESGYQITKNLYASSGISLPPWVPTWISTQSSWIGYVAVCNDKEAITKLGRRDVVIALRGTATCLEWLENLQATLTQLPEMDPRNSGLPGPMVGSGFLSLYTSGTSTRPSLQHLVRGEVRKILDSYGDEPLSLTITGHSLGAALALLAAYDIKTTLKNAPLVTVISFGGPRVGNKSFRLHVEKQGIKILRIVNSDDVVTKVPGLAYTDVGREMRLSSRSSPYLSRNFNVATCHNLSTYLYLINGFVSSTCPFRATARKMTNNFKKMKLKAIE